MPDSRPRRVDEDPAHPDRWYPHVLYLHVFGVFTVLLSPVLFTLAVIADLITGDRGGSPG